MPTPRDAIYPRLALSSLLWWSDSRDEAIAELTRVVDASRAESDLRLDLAELLEQERAFADALAVLDEVQPLDNATLRRREDIALRLAVNSGNHDRARHAAQRLFGLRLDTDTQIRLSGQMNQLGLHEQADALLGRARRRAGNKAAALVRPDAPVSATGKAGRGDAGGHASPAVVARGAGVTQRIGISTVTGQAVSMVQDGETDRVNAIAVLASSGRLSQLIARALEEQKTSPDLGADPSEPGRLLHRRPPAPARPGPSSKSSPCSVPTTPTCGSRSPTSSLARARPSRPSPTTRRPFRKTRRSPPAHLPRSKTCWCRAPNTTSCSHYSCEVDLRSTASPGPLARTLDVLPEDPKLTERIAAVFKKAWSAFPEQRYMLVGMVHRDDIWQMPEMYDFARTRSSPSNPLAGGADGPVVHVHAEAPVQRQSYRRPGTSVGDPGRRSEQPSRRSRTFLDLAERQAGSPS